MKQLSILVSLCFFCFVFRQMSFHLPESLKCSQKSGMVFYGKIPARIRSLRKLQQRTLTEIAGGCGLSVCMLSKIESGKTRATIATLNKIADALDVALFCFRIPMNHQQW